MGVMCTNLANELGPHLVHNRIQTLPFWQFLGGFNNIGRLQTQDPWEFGTSGRKWRYAEPPNGFV